MNVSPPPASASAWTAWRFVAAVVALWSTVSLTLSWSQYQDLTQLGQTPSFGYLLLQYWVATLMQMLFTLAVGLLLQRHPDWVKHPVRLVVGALVAIPLYLAVATPTSIFLLLVAKGKPLSGWWPALQQWPAVNLYVDMVTAAGVMSLLLGWSFWRQAQARRQQVLQARAENLRLRLHLLQGQLEPHFMFNTLNSIAALVRGADRAVALAALSRLSELLRYSLRASQRRWVSVADELGFMADYVALQRLRFGDSLQWQQQLQPLDWARWACPPLLLQPLIEAAIRQGLESAAQAPVTLVMSRQAECLVLQLRQRPLDSTGSVCTFLPEVQAALERVQERVRVLYGDAAAWQCHPSDVGFDWQLSWPLRDLDDLGEASA
ncbi:hypothetical protein HNQ51_000494 [Inhella inkyongensis]|uniref:Signal transduction histidine kinase internal region domain-containing protein n=1 Tax=Inhella inkyongensis TaxID=392593 RepID=A0A840S3F3_9BURK|nr:sensor histidine kinase [Inhella inkyongensis]MBB5203201.1 hypothetical protein [Inhella inkyongensis]